MSDHITHTLDINDLLTRFFQAFDEKNWPMMRGCLCDEVDTDYSSFRGVPPATISADHYVEQRRSALHTLDMQHNFLNLRVEFAEATDTATARCNYIVYRFHTAYDGYYHSQGHYLFGFTVRDGAWKISRIVQHLLRSQGDPEIHGAHNARDRSERQWS
jgi:SnoaL-like domain